LLMKGRCMDFAFSEFCRWLEPEEVHAANIQDSTFQIPRD
jgi:hypothetical protein